MEASKNVAPGAELQPTPAFPVATLRLEKPLATQRMPDPEASQPSFAPPAIGVGSSNKPAVWIILGVIFVFVILIGGGVALYSLKSWSGTTARQPTPGSSPTPANGTTPAVASATAELVKIEGGTFQMGRNDVAQDSKNTYDLSQYPARPVVVKTFWMDKTEVTNAEYENFGRETKHSLPSYWRDGKPPAGQEQWPVTGVSLDDADAFAQWRSKRDHLKYRLPTEEEWEYAARNGSQATLYPWGNQWLVDRANVETNSLEPVGSHPQGASSRGGLLDLIGNAWEWTSTTAAPYPGNTLLSIPPGQFIIRGGAFSDKASGPENITATRRSWLSRTRKEPFVGFRLAREEP
jgi:formylglycine-generating enzyme required for sulfatase activity